MKNELIIVKNNWERSGNGDGSRLLATNDCDSDVDSTERELINANDRKNFLNGRSSAVLYLWVKAEHHDIIDTVCQQLDDSIGFDSSDNIASPLTKTKKRKRDNVGSDHEDADLKALRKTMETTNSTIETSERNRHRLELIKLVSEYEDKVMAIEDKLEAAEKTSRTWQRLTKKLADAEETLEKITEELDDMQ